MSLKLCNITLPLLMISGCDRFLSSAEDTHLAKEIASLSCERDDDCAVIKTGCCSCAQGGQQQAVAKNAVEKRENQSLAACKDTMCMQMISKHPSCQKQARCVSNQCVLQ